MEGELEDCIWGRTEWQHYVEKLINAEVLDENVLLERIEVVKSNVGRQIRKAIEQHHPKLVEQASALHGLDLVQATISREMSHLFATSEELSNRFASFYGELNQETLILEQLYSLRRILFAAHRCEQLVRRVNVVNELVKQSEMICELESITSEFPQLKEISWLKDSLLLKAPKVAAEARRRTVQQLKSSLESLNGPLVSSCERALRNLSCYETEVNSLMDENIKNLDAQFLKLVANPDSAPKTLPSISSQIQDYIEQFALLGDDSVSLFCAQFAQIITNRVPNNAPYACRILQLFTPIFSQIPAPSLQEISEAFRPLKTLILSQSLNRMFVVINSAFEDPNLQSAVAEKVSSVMRKELCSVDWDSDLKAEMEGNISKAMELAAQKVEQLLRLDEESLLIGERISAVQVANYNLLNAAYALCKAWPNHNSPLLRVARQGREAIMTVGRSSISKILLSMHTEELKTPSPYAKELCEYLNSFQLHVFSFLPLAKTDDALAAFIDYVFEVFLINATLLRPTSAGHLSKLAEDLNFVSRTLFELFDFETHCLNCAPDFAKALCMPVEELADTDHLPSWAVVQLLISHSEPSLLSPHKAIDHTLQQYVEWFCQLTVSEKLKFLSSVIESYTSSIISRNCTEYVSTYPLILKTLERAACEH